MTIHRDTIQYNVLIQKDLEMIDTSAVCPCHLSCYYTYTKGCLARVLQDLRATVNLCYEIPLALCRCSNEPRIETLSGTQAAPRPREQQLRSVGNWGGVEQ